LRVIKRFIVYLLLILLTFSQVNCGITKNTTTGGSSARSSSIAYSNSPHAKALAGAAYGVSEYLGMQQEGQIRALDGLQVNSLYVRNNKIPKFWDDRELLSANIEIRGEKYFQELESSDDRGDFKVEKYFKYNSIYTGDHYQGSFDRRLESFVTRNPNSSFMWHSRNAVYDIRRTTSLNVFSDPAKEVNFNYVAKEEDSQYYGSGELTKANGMKFYFNNFKIESVLDQDVVTESIKTSVDINNAKKFEGSWDPDQGTAFLVDDVGELKANYHQLKIKGYWAGRIRGNDNSDNQKSKWTSGYTPLLTLSSKNSAYSAGSTSSGSGVRVDQYVQGRQIKVFDGNDNELFSYEGPNTNARVFEYTANYDDTVSLYHRSEEVFVSIYWEVKVDATYTVTDEYLDQIKYEEDAERMYRVWIENGQVYYEQKLKDGNIIEISKPISNSGASDPAIKRSDDKLYVSWIQDGTELYYNIVDMNGTVKLKKKGLGSAVVEMFYSTILDARQVTGHIKLRNEFEVVTAVVINNSNKAYGGDEVVEESTIIKTEVLDGSVYKEGKLIGYIKEGKLTNGDLEVYDTSNSLVNPQLIWEYYQ
jgi:hypothetical protein